MTTKDETLERLAAVRKARAEEEIRAASRLVQLARKAREEKATWPEIAQAMGMTRQGLRLFLKRNGS